MMRCALPTFKSIALPTGEILSTIQAHGERTLFSTGWIPKELPKTSRDMLDSAIISEGTILPSMVTGSYGIHYP